jgi:hypothetical protein
LEGRRAVGNVAPVAQLVIDPLAIDLSRRYHPARFLYQDSGSSKALLTLV